MARVLVLADRDMRDPEWKGPLIWSIVLSLAESQHEVLVASPLESELIPISHPRLNVVRPVTSWGALGLGALSKLILNFRPQVLQTFALAPSKTLPALSVWPYMSQLGQAARGIRKVVSLFDETDARGQALSWYRSADAVTAFNERQRLRLEKKLERPVQALPMEMPAVGATSEQAPEILVPAAVSEWTFPESMLHQLVRFSEEHADREIHILGGWGDWPPARRKAGWEILEKVAARIHLSEAPILSEFTALAARSGGLWLEPLAQDSWRYLAAAHLGGKLGKRLYLPDGFQPVMNPGSTANTLSRLYLS